MTQRIVPALWFDHCALEGARFHVDAFASALGDLAGDEAATGVVLVSHYPTERLPDFQKDFAGDVLEVRYRVCGFELSGINSDSTFSMDPSISLSVVLDPALVPDAEDRLRALHAALLAGGGSELMPLGAYPFSPLYAWVADTYGMTWQLSVSSGDEVATASEIAEADEVASGAALPPAPIRIAPSLLFAGEEAPAARALAAWVEVFDRAFASEPSQLGPLVLYRREGREEADALLHGTAILAGTPVFAMDNGGPQDFGFSCGLSFSVQCDTQEQIDAVWEGLSAVPEAEICGWLQDRFGVSWQVGPTNMGEYIELPGAYALMASMKKPKIAAYEALRG